MTKIHEALKLADDLDAYHTRAGHKQSAAKMREMHALIVQMGQTLDAILDEMTVGDRWTNTGQHLLDSHAAAKEYLK